MQGVGTMVSALIKCRSMESELHTQMQCKEAFEDRNEAYIEYGEARTRRSADAAMS